MEEFVLKERLHKHLSFIYPSISKGLLDEIVETVLSAKSSDAISVKWSEKDVVLITYGDSIISEGETPLQSLQQFLSTKLLDEISCVHILPFFPYSSDDGFSVIDYMKVDPALGTWNDVIELNRDFDIMADLVVNHISQFSNWFQEFLKGKPKYKEYFIVADPASDYSKVVRPRSLPLLTEYKTSDGLKNVWTTFSADQIDLNFGNPEVLLEMLKVLLFYLHKGARIIRLDAIAFLWKELGTSCLHLPQTHAVVKLMRDVIEFVKPSAILLTETNVPNAENLSYFGTGDEAHMVYQFSLPPLLLHALHTGNSEYLNEWAYALPEPPSNCTYFNFTASHDGIGLRPLEGLLPKEEFADLVDNMKSFGGKVSMKKNTDGTDSPYELNITYFDACKGTNQGEDEYQLARFLCSQAVLLSMKGVPAIYIHSFTATPNYYSGVEETGRARTINRMKWDKHILNATLQENGSSKFVFNTLKKLIKIRKHQVAFHPDSEQEILRENNSVFVVKRGGEPYAVECVVNVSRLKVLYTIDSESVDLISAQLISEGEYELSPYQVLWLKKMQL